jgi:hypothetical protein
MALGAACLWPPVGNQSTSAAESRSAHAASLCGAPAPAQAQLGGVRRPRHWK